MPCLFFLSPLYLLALVLLNYTLPREQNPNQSKSYGNGISRILGIYYGNASVLLVLTTACLLDAGFAAQMVSKGKKLAGRSLCDMQQSLRHTWTFMGRK